MSVNGSSSAMPHYAQRFFLTLLVIVCVTVTASGQLSDKILAVKLGTVHAGEPLTLQVDLVGSNTVDRIEIAFRQFGQSGYRRIEMMLSGNSAAITIPSVFITPPSIDYYFILYPHGQNSGETYPVEQAEQHPLTMNLESQEPALSKIVILSPEQDERVLPDDLVISFSITNADSSFSSTGIKVYLDGADLSTTALISDNLVVVRPGNTVQSMSGGQHVIRVELQDKQGKLIDSLSWNFSASGNPEPAAATERSPWLYHSNVQLETRNESISDASTAYNRASISANGMYHEFRVDGKLYVTNEETDVRQPQNRFFISATSPWLTIGYGDSYPTFPDMIMSGKRVRGLTGNLSLGGFNLDITKGEIVRHVESTVLKTFPESTLTTEQTADPNAAYGLFDPASSPRLWAKYRYGTFNRSLFAIRPSFGKRDESHLGFTYLKSSDEIGSIRYGIKPEENLVVGSDLLITLDHRNIEITGQGAFSASNRDIASGSFSDSTIDEVYKDYDQSFRDRIRRIRNIFSNIITVNENLIPLALKDVPTLAYEYGFSLNYFSNSFKLRCLRHGDSYESFGQSYLRTDVVGYNVSDRIRLVNNQVFLSGGFERLQDNTANTKSSTTTGRTATVSLSYYPRTEAPNVTVAYLLASNDNDRTSGDSLSVDDRTNRISVQVGKEFVFGVKHNALLSVSTSTRDDQTFRNLDTKNTTVTLSATSTFPIPLQTVFSLTFNSSEFVAPTINSSSTSLSYTMVHCDARYRLMEDRLHLSGSLSPTFGDLQRVLLDASAQYYFTNNLSAQTQLSLYLNQKYFNAASTTNDIIWSIILRADV